MRVLLVACVTIAGLLAGCSGADPEAKGDTGGADFTDIEVEVSEESGVILGVVVDDVIKPVAGANVTARGGSVNVTTSTDDSGRFVFDDLVPGTYFVAATASLHHPGQTSVDVKAGEREPRITRIQLERFFTQEPYMAPTISHDGFFQCSQNGLSAFYSSSNCMDGITGSYGTDETSNLTRQDREWHMDVGPGWQTIVFEMTWTPSAYATSPRMGLVVSTYKPTRDTAHSFANYASASPMYFTLDPYEKGPGAASVDPETIPEEGMADVSFFASVRGEPPTNRAVAINQQFRVFASQFYYGVPPEGWSFVNGDGDPFGN
jgi:hypothetical protein